MRVAVTGGSGFVGIHTVRALKNAGHEIVVVARGTVRRPKGDRVTFVQADLTDSPKLADIFAGCDAVVHLVAVINQRGRKQQRAARRAANTMSLVCEIIRRQHAGASTKSA